MDRDPRVVSGGVGAIMATNARVRAIPDEEGNRAAGGGWPPTFM